MDAMQSTRSRRVRHPRRARRFVALLLAVLTLVPLATSVVTNTQVAQAAGGSGYWLVGTDGGIFSFGEAGFHGSTGDISLNQPIVGIAPTPTGKGYWMVASDGGIFAFGDAGFYGSMGGKPLNKPIVALAPAPNGRGYWMVASDGGIFAFGDAPFFGSMGAEKLNRPIVDVAASPTGRGYWMAASDGGIFAFGDAGFFGSTGAIELTQRIHAMAPSPNGRGYWLAAGDGGIFAFGDAKFHGGAAGSTEKRVLDIAASPSGLGYYLTTSAGIVMAYGDARHYGDTETAKIKLNSRIAAMSAMGNNAKAVAVEDTIDVNEDEPIAIDVLANDTDPEGDKLTVTSTSPPLHGTATVSENKVQYKPAADYNGTDLFTYTVSDATGATSLGRVNVTIKAVDDRPGPRDDSVSILEDVALGIPVLLNDGGLGDGVATLAVVSPPGNGQATVSGKVITYKANENFTGEDSFEYEVTDVDGDTGRGRVRVTVSDADDMPDAIDDDDVVEWGEGIDINVEANDRVPDKREEIKLVQGDEIIEDASITTALGGEVRRDRGRIHYSAPADPDPATPGNALTDEFRYVVIDRDNDMSAPATVRIAVSENAPARLCTACDPYIIVVAGSSYKVPSDELGKLVVRNFRSESLTLQITSGGATADPDGSIIYGPAPAQQTDSFSFLAHDGNSPSNERNVRVCIKAEDGSPNPVTEDTTHPCYKGSDDA